ncbi:MAG: peptidase S8, partial [Bacteroidetes bacterium SW_10_40_5]
MNNHQEFGNRVTQGDGASSLSDHATHVAGTIIGAGVKSDAQGMAPDAELTAYNWGNDDSEMASAASNGLEISNHSYGYLRGWYKSNGEWNWGGDESISSTEDYRFGFYSNSSKDWDQIAYNAPHYLIVKSAGNDRGDGPGSDPSTAEQDGGANGYDCIGTRGVAKNLLTVGAAKDVTNYTGPESVDISSFSSFGPADDGRIKPDIVANGVGLYSSTANNTSSYSSYSGTSMSSPNTTGVLALLQKHYRNTHGGASMNAATMKAL